MYIYQYSSQQEYSTEYAYRKNDSCNRESDSILISLSKVFVFLICIYIYFFISIVYKIQNERVLQLVFRFLQFKERFHFEPFTKTNSYFRYKYSHLKIIKRFLNIKTKNMLLIFSYNSLNCYY